MAACSPLLADVGLSLISAPNMKDRRCFLAATKISKKARVTNTTCEIKKIRLPDLGSTEFFFKSSS